MRTSRFDVAEPSSLKAKIGAAARRLAPHVTALRAELATSTGAAPPGGLSFLPTPAAPAVAARHPGAALAFLRDPATAGDGSTANEAFRVERATINAGLSSPDLRTQVDAIGWYHTIVLPGGVTTPGQFDHRQLVGDYGLPTRLDGQRVLDVATFDGFWAFELERRGAAVTALDLPSSLHLDLPPAARARAECEAIGVNIGLGFGVAARALGSSVQRVEGSVYDLTPEAFGSFDLVHMGDLLLHLERPLDALRAVRSICSGELHISEAYDPSLVGPTVRYLGGWSDVEWWVPSLETLVQWLVDAGFDEPRILRTYQLNTRGNEGGFWRAIIRAR